MDYLSKLENQSVYIMREAFNKFENLAMLWSIGKDSTVLLWLARKAFLGHVPFPLVHVDTSYKIASMIEYRDRLVKEWNLKLVVGRNESALADGATYPNGRATRVECCGTLKKDALKAVLDKHHYTGVIVGVRRDEEPTRAKETVFQPAGQEHGMERGGPAAGVVGPIQDGFRAGDPYPHPSAAALDGVEHLGVHRAGKDSRHPALFCQQPGERYRSIGCAPCTMPIQSQARSVREIIEELRHTKTSERSGRAQDKESEDAFEKLRRDGYM